MLACAVILVLLVTPNSSQFLPYLRYVYVSHLQPWSTKLFVGGHLKDGARCAYHSPSSPELGAGTTPA